MKKFWLALAIVVVCVVALRLKYRHQENALGVLSDPIQKDSIIESVYGIGTVTAERNFQLKAGVISTVRGLAVKEGDTVKRGDKLLALDEAVFTAPFDGTVTWIPVKEGENVFPQSLILSVVDLADRYFVVTIEQRGALRVRQGQKARINFDSMRGETFHGTVTAVYSHESNFLARIDVTGLPPQILPGMTGDVAIAIAEHKDALLVPVEAIEAGKVRVKTLLGTDQTVEVKIGVVDGAMAQIVSGDKI